MITIEFNKKDIEIENNGDFIKVHINLDTLPINKVDRQEIAIQHIEELNDEYEVGITDKKDFFRGCIKDAFQDEIDEYADDIKGDLLEEELHKWEEEQEGYIDAQIEEGVRARLKEIKDQYNWEEFSKKYNIQEVIK